ncbi:FecR family protein [Kaistia nematophila]|uniref:FecR domain-containing protein n=1 Tax=Kaistia nematophila TaxID=2994654 RepID=A0A9X3E2X9_9HYPH|nr:FecR domain-containing protein [Kaistia nematophila]MCX5570241.1 FecR domain-containing protein [Kaistia nematophila]
MRDLTPETDRLLDEAIDLVIRLQAAPDNPVAIKMVRAWRARSPQHEHVWTQVAEVHGMSGQVLTEQAKAARRRGSAPSRRNFMLGGAVGLGALAAGSLFGPDAILRARADYVTEKGEIRRVPLPDGSVATLGPDTAISIAFNGATRDIALLQGMSFFAVAPDFGRPFQVKSGSIAAIAQQAAFDITSDAGIVSVSVDTGEVETRIDRPAIPSLDLAAGDWMSFDAAAQLVERGRREPGQIGGWRDKLILAEREPVAALVARIGRWVPGRIVIADPFVGAQRVSGLFDLSDPHRALEAVVLPAGGRVRQASSFLTVISPI